MAQDKLTRGYADFSDNALSSLHKGIAKVYENDRSLTSAQKEAAQVFGSQLNYFGVDEFPDWKAHGEALEQVLTARNLQFVPLVF